MHTVYSDNMHNSATKSAHTSTNQLYPKTINNFIVKRQGRKNTTLRITERGDTKV